MFYQTDHFILFWNIRLLSPLESDVLLNHAVRLMSYMDKMAVEVKLTFTLEQAIKAQRGIRGVALLFLQPRR
jgi:hypothetical protein